MSTFKEYEWWNVFDGEVSEKRKLSERFRENKSFLLVLGY